MKKKNRKENIAFAEFNTQQTDIATQTKDGAKLSINYVALALLRRHVYNIRCFRLLCADANH